MGLSRQQVKTVIRNNITDPLGRQNTARRHREAEETIVENFFNLEEDNLDINQVRGLTEALGDINNSLGFGNDARIPIKCVRGITAAQAGAGYASRDGLNPLRMCLGTICYSEFAAKEEDKITKLIYDDLQTEETANPLKVYIDGRFTGVLVPAKWVPLNSEEAAAAGILPFNPRYQEGDDPTKGYVKKTTSVPASIVTAQDADGNTRFAVALQNMSVAQFPQGIPAPAFDGPANPYWAEASPPATPQASYQHLTNVTAKDLAQEDSVIWDRPYIIHRFAPNEDPNSLSTRGEPIESVLIYGLDGTHFTKRGYLFPMDGSQPIEGEYDLEKDAFAAGGGSGEGPAIYQETGTSETGVMSQQAVTKELESVNASILDFDAIKQLVLAEQNNYANSGNGPGGIFNTRENGTGSRYRVMLLSLPAATEIGINETGIPPDKARLTVVARVPASISFQLLGNFGRTLPEALPRPTTYFAREFVAIDGKWVEVGVQPGSGSGSGSGGSGGITQAQLDAAVGTLKTDTQAEFNAPIVVRNSSGVIVYYGSNFAAANAFGGGHVMELNGSATLTANTTLAVNRVVGNYSVLNLAGFRLSLDSFKDLYELEITAGSIASLSTADNPTQTPSLTRCVLGNNVSVVFTAANQWLQLVDTDVFGIQSSGPFGTGAGHLVLRGSATADLSRQGGQSTTIEDRRSTSTSGGVPAANSITEAMLTVALRGKATVKTGNVPSFSFTENGDYQPVSSGTFTANASGAVVGITVFAYLTPTATEPVLGAAFQLVSGQYQADKNLMYAFKVGGNGKIQYTITELPA